MSHSYQLQGWNTLNGPAGGTVKQGEEGYLDLSGYQDFAAYLEVSTSSPTGLTVDIDTSPIKEDSYFRSVATFGSLTTGVQTPVVVRWATASTPPARYLRWRVTAATAWNLTFRIWISANQAGGR